jgi:hypothetical protein
MNNAARAETPLGPSMCRWVLEVGNFVEKAYVTLPRAAAEHGRDRSKKRKKRCEARVRVEPESRECRERSHRVWIVKSERENVASVVERG